MTGGATQPARGVEVQTSARQMSSVQALPSLQAAPLVGLWAQRLRTASKTSAVQGLRSSHRAAWSMSAQPPLRQSWPAGQRPTGLAGEQPAPASTH